MKPVLPRLLQAAHAAATTVSTTPSSAAAAATTASRLTGAPAALGRRAGIVTTAAQHILNQSPTTGAVAHHIRFQAKGLCGFNIEDLHLKVLSALANLPRSVFGPAMRVVTNPSAEDIELAVQNHGPVRLKLQGSLPENQGGDVYTVHHTTLVTAVLRDPESGRRIAVMADGNDLANNPLKATADAHAELRRKRLWELNEQDYEQINAKIADEKPGDRLTRSFFRLVDLDQALANHRATQEGLRQQAEERANAPSTASTWDLLMGNNALPPITASEIVFAKEVKMDGRMSEGTEAALLALIRSNPALVERPGHGEAQLPPGKVDACNAKRGGD
jgi:hypothetical protein